MKLNTMAAAVTVARDPVLGYLRSDPVTTWRGD